MTTEVFYFLLGTLFAYGISFDIHRITKVFSFTILFYFTFTRIDYVEIPLNLHKFSVFIIFMLFENSLLPNFMKLKLVSRIGVLIMIIGYFFSIFSVYYLKSKEGKYPYLGPYSIMRQPCYFGMILFASGCVLFIGLIISIPFGYLLFKDEMLEIINKQEDDIMKDDIGYKKYKSYVKMFGVV